jgi:hypothetical protein
VNQSFGKVNGERNIQPAPISEPIYNSGRAKILDKVIEEKEFFRVASEPGESGTMIHKSAIKFDQINQSEFCVSCHQVAVNLGIKLEVVWDQYRASPAAARGVTCQDSC